MKGIEFLQIEYLWLLIPVVIIVLIYLKMRNKDYFEFLVFSIITVLLIIALAQPVIKKGYKTIYKTDTEIMILLDRSLSMAVDDLKPNRFEVAKNKVLKLLNNLEDVMVGLILFSDKSDVVFMPYDRKDEISKYLKDLPVDLKGSTNLLDAFSTANSLLTSKKRIVILVSDGGDDDISNLINLVKNSNLIVIYYGIATVKGGKIPGYNAVSKLNLSLEKITEISDGITVKVSKNDEDIREITEFIQNITEKTKKEILKIPDYFELTPIIGGIILGLILLNFGIKRLTASLIVFFISTASSSAGDLQGYFFYIMGDYKKSAEEFIKDKDPYSQYNGAVSYIKGNMCDKAEPILKNIKTDDLELIKKIKYNLSVCLITKGKFKDAKKILEDIIQIFPDDRKLIKLYTFTNMVINLNKKPEKKITIVEIKEDKPKKHEKSQMEVGDRNPW